MKKSIFIFIMFCHLYSMGMENRASKDRGERDYIEAVAERICITPTTCEDLMNTVQETAPAFYRWEREYNQAHHSWTEEEHQERIDQADFLLEETMKLPELSQEEQEIAIDKARSGYALLKVAKKVPGLFGLTSWCMNKGKDKAAKDLQKELYDARIKNDNK